MSVQEIEKAIEQLPASELSELATWVAERHHAVWDAQIENDLESGRQDTWLNEVENELRHKTHRVS